MQVKKFFIGCLPAMTTESEIFAHFSKFCHIIKLKVNYRSNGICAGYGHFTTSINNTQLESLLQTRHIHRGRILECRLYMKGKRLKLYLKDFKERRIYVKNVPTGTTDWEFYHLFSKVCEVERAYIANDLGTNGLQFGFVITKEAQSAQNLIEVGELMFRGKKLKLEKSKERRDINPKPKTEKKLMETLEFKKHWLKPPPFKVMEKLIDQIGFNEKDKYFQRRRNSINCFKTQKKIKLVKTELPCIIRFGEEDLRYNTKARRASISGLL